MTGVSRPVPALLLAGAAFSLLASAASPACGGDFVRLRKPGPTDWRTVFPEPIQTLQEYERDMGRAPTFEERRILLVPCGAMHERPGESLAELAEFLGAYCMTRVEIEERLPVSDDIPRRSSHGFGRQLLADGVLRHLGRAPSGGTVARIAVTADDLYADGPSGRRVNWVFGMGDARRRAAVCSYARLSWHYPGEPAGATPRRRFFKLAAHEVGHVLGMAHCQTYVCGMNGSNSLVESDAAPVHLCPECLAKIERHLGFDRAQRYAALERVYRKLGWRGEAEFVARRRRAEAGAALTAARRPSHDGPGATAGREARAAPPGGASE